MFPRDMSYPDTDVCEECVHLYKKIQLNIGKLFN